jgi:hypothetical protein
MALINKSKKKDTKSQVEEIKKQIAKSKTFYSPGAEPTARDIQLEQNLIKAKNEKEMADNSALRDRWYGVESTEDEIKEKNSGWLDGFLTTLSAPMSAIAGAVEFGLGKGSEKTLIDNIAANVKERGSYGDILRSYDIPNYVAMPAGLGLDILLDPINWATVGTSAILPRIGKGAIAGARSGTGLLKGAALGAKSGVLGKAEKVLRAIPGVAKRGFGEVPAGKSIYRDLALKADVENALYETLTGDTLENMIKAAQGTWPTKVATKIGQKIDEQKFGEGLRKTFHYDEAKKFREMVAAEDVARSGQLDTAVAAKEMAKKDFQSKFSSMAKTKDEFLAEIQKIPTMEKLTKVGKDGSEALTTGGRAATSQEASLMMDALSQSENQYRNAFREAIDELENSGVLQGKAAERFSALPETLEKGVKGLSKERVASTYNTLKTGMEGFDKTLASWLTTPVGKKLIDSYSTAISLFKTSKLIPYFGSSAVNAAVGNWTMYKMMGLDSTPEFWNMMKEATKVMRGGESGLKAAANLAKDQNWVQMLNNYPDLFQSIYGVNARLMQGGRGYLDSVIDQARKIGNAPTPEEINKMYSAFDNMVSDMSAKGVAADAKVKAKLKELTRKGTSVSEAATTGDLSTTMISGEVLSGPYTNFVNSIKDMADNGTPGMKALHWLLTKPMDDYSKIDQTYRLGAAMHMTKNGISAKELKLIAKRIPLSVDDIVKVEGRDAYRISPMKATEVVNTAFMNYLAMPGFVKAMRSLPLLGAPFMSFAYGMTTGLLPQTAFKNTSIINKIQFAINELNGLKTPLEKVGLDSKYYNYLDQPGMVKLNMLPIFGDNPVYLNLENMLGYYTALPFQEYNRTYGDRFGGKVAKVLDASPFAKDPVGQWMLDYFVLPMALGEATGSFGQQLWPKDASVVEKAGTALRGAAEIFAPSQLGYLGYLTPTELAPYLPSYNWRSTTYSKEGKGSTGVQTKTPPGEKMITRFFSQFGLPTYKMDLTKIKTSDKKKKTTNK